MQKNKKLMNSMSRLIGHAESNRRLIEKDAYCIDIINQNQAVISALHKVNKELLSQHLDSCVVDAIKGTSRKKRTKALDEISAIFAKKK